MRVSWYLGLRCATDTRDAPGLSRRRWWRGANGGHSDVRTRRSRCHRRSATRLLQRRRPAKAHIVLRVSNGRPDLAGNGWQSGDACRAWRSCWELIPDEMGSEPAVVHPPEGPHSSLRDPPCGWASAPASCRSWEVGKGGHQLKWNSAPPYTRHPPSPPCPVFASSQSGNPRWLALSLPPRCCRGRSQASLCCVIFQQPISRPVRPIRLTWAAGPNIHVYSPIPSSPHAV